LVELRVVAVSAVLAGAESWVEIELWAPEKWGWLRRYLKLEQGTALHDPFGRLVGLIDPQELEAAFRRGVSGRRPALGSEAGVAIDGKTRRRPGTRDVTPWH
jgi:hypothetical protein